MIMLLLLIVSMVTTFACHNGGLDCHTYNSLALIPHCRFCCFDNYQAWDIGTPHGAPGGQSCGDFPGSKQNFLVNDRGRAIFVCDDGDVLGVCHDFTSKYGTTGSTSSSGTNLVNVGSAVTVVCFSPYYLIGPAVVNCVSTPSYIGVAQDGSTATCTYCGVWTTIPNCILGCGSITVANAAISYAPTLVGTVAAGGTTANITCLTNYYAVGGSSTLTCVTPNFGTPCKCLRGCPSITSTANMTISYNTATVGSNLYSNLTVATFMCDSGCYLSTTPTSPNGVCTNGVWGTLPTCILGCVPTPIANGLVTYDHSVVGGTLYPPTTIATFNCSVGYYLSTIQTTITQTCTSGVWGTLPICIRGCNATGLRNGSIAFTPPTITNYVYQNSATAVFTCSGGYYLSTLTTSLTLNCTGGSWGAEPTCKQGCLTASINDGTIVYNPSLTTSGLYQSATTATFNCITGFYLNTLNPTEVQTCTNGVWGPQLTCLRGCSATSINNGTITYIPSTTTNSLYQSGAEAIFTCDVGFYLSSLVDTTVETCSSGSWGASLSCIEGCFEYQNATTGYITYSPNNTINGVYQANGNASISCYTNYYTSGIQTSNCSSGNWTSDLYCLLGCKPLTTFANGKCFYNPSIVSNLVYPIATVADFGCEMGYSRRGSVNTKCLNGNWTNPLPYCEATPWEWLALVMDITCTFLLISLGITFMTFALLREFSIETILHMGEELSLFCAHIFIFFFRSRIDLGLFCQITAICLQYFFIVAYTFFLLESLQFFCILQNIISFGGPWEYPRFRLLVIGWVFAFIPTGITFALRYDYDVSTFSCWLNIGDDIAFGSIMPLAVLFVITVIMTEAAAMGDPKALPLTDWPQHMAAIFNQKSILIIMTICSADWFIGLFATYHLTIFLGLSVLALNVALGVCVWVFHYMGTPASNKWFNKHIRRRFCKNTSAPVIETSNEQTYPSPDRNHVC